MTAFWLVLALNATTPVPQSVYDFTVSTLEGAKVSLAEYRGKELLIVNTASRCGYTPQYEGLEQLYTKYKERGLVILGFPSNDFGSQEPGTNQEIRKFCQAKYNVTFPMFGKGPVKGAEKQPLFKYLTANAPQNGEIKWNFEKFLVTATGVVIGRYNSKVTPADPDLIAAIAKYLPH